MEKSLRRDKSLLRLSKEGVKGLKKLEGLKLKVYADQAGHNTIGYGHRLNYNPGPITTATAENFLAEDLKIFEHVVKQHVLVDLSQNEFDALVIFAFNIGQVAFGKSTLVKLLNEAKYDEAVKQFKRWKYVTIEGKKEVSQGLVRRRLYEEKLFARREKPKKVEKLEKFKFND